MSIREKTQKFCKQWPESEWGPGHIVLSDENLFDSSLDFCLDLIARKDFDAGERAEGEIEATEAFLKELRAIPEAERLAEFEDEE